MSNMHHCRFHNTLMDLHDLEEDLLDPVAELNEDEQEAKEKMIKLIHRWHEELREQESMRYSERQKEWLEKNDIQIESTVRNVRPAESGENGWGEQWSDGMNKYLGEEGEVIGIEPDEGILVLVKQGHMSYDYFYPYFVLEKV